MTSRQSPPNPANALVNSDLHHSARTLSARPAPSVSPPPKSSKRVELLARGRATTRTRSLRRVEALSDATEKG